MSILVRVGLPWITVATAEIDRGGGNALILASPPRPPRPPWRGGGPSKGVVWGAASTSASKTQVMTGWTAKPSQSSADLFSLTNMNGR